MSTIITLPELDTPEAFATKYLVEKIGYNIRPGSCIYDKEINSYIIDCTAIISNYITYKLLYNEDKGHESEFKTHSTKKTLE